MKQLLIGKKIIVTPLPYLNELPVSNEDKIILDFNLSNIKDVVEKIKSIKSQNNANATNYGKLLADNYKKYLAKGKSNYKELRSRMKKVKAIKKFKDMSEKTLRNIGDEFLCDGARAEHLLELGLVNLVEDVKEKAIEIETAVKKEVKKEKAVKEKKNGKK